MPQSTDPICNSSDPPWQYRSDLWQYQPATTIPFQPV